MSDDAKREGLSDEEVDAAVLAVKKRFGESVKWRMTSQSEVERVIYRAALAAPASVRAGSTIIMDGSTEGSVELRELQGAVQESLPAATARGNSSPAGVESGPSALSPASAQTPVGEVAAWECRHFDPQYGWSPWERIEPRHRLETIEGRVNDIREFIKLGNKYQLRALYAEGEPEGYAHE